MGTSLRHLAIAVLLFGLAAQPAHADYRSGLAAYEAGHYAEALGELLPLSERGDAEAEFMLGVMYYYGRGVPRDDGLAAVWFFKAARKGSASGQLAFGSLYIRGTGVRRNLGQAYLWLTLAAESGVPGLQQQALQLRDDAARLMAPDDVEKARRLAANFRPARAGLTSWR